MNQSAGASKNTVNTILGPVPADQLGVIAVSESLLSVLPGAQYAPEISMDRSEIVTTLAAKLEEFRAAGGSTIVDTAGMFHGRDIPMYEALSRSTGINIIASTGMGPEEMLGGYFLTPQTNPPTPWPAEKFRGLFTQEVTEGMVVPRVERRGPAGVVVTAAADSGMTATEESLHRGAAGTGLDTGLPVVLRFGADPLAELDIVIDEGLSADRVVVAGLDRKNVDRDAITAVLDRGAFVLFDHVGTDDDAFITDDARTQLITEFIADGHTDRILLATSAIGVAKGLPDNDVPFGHVLTDFLPKLVAGGVGEDVTRALVTDNPRTLLALR